MSSNAKEIDFGAIKDKFTTVKQQFDFITNHDKW